ncbi:MAG: phosphopantothenoylcysteine decarboxylase [Planctomycetes bacterium]|nr:phosphopantothenoylcysteine decarboxylase [Planctomycetota bacterium]MBI3834548.1 phosphopantothenoylcysteine decarboxylase [Planctomycetota bacterium]
MPPTGGPLAPQDLAGYEVVVCVSGGIAAYKVCEVVSRLVQRGAGVTVAMTRAARKFVGPTTFQALSGRRVLTTLWDHESGDVQHVAMTDAADLLVVAPATADLIGRIAAGLADDVVTTLVITASAPVLVAPAMNERMWANPIVQRNANSLREQKRFQFIGPGSGWMACRAVGPGRMTEPAEILEAATALLRSTKPRSVK